MKLCTACKHYLADYAGYRGEKGDMCGKNVDPVRGGPKYNCRHMREFEYLCGEDASFWVPI